MSARQVYSSTVTSRVHLAIGLGLAVVAGVFAAAAGPVAAILVALLVAISSIFVSTVRLVVGPEHVVLGWGPLPWPSRPLPMAAVAGAEAESLSVREVLGGGPAWRWGMTRTRLTIRPGPTLALTLKSGERIRISTADPQAAVDRIHAVQTNGRATPARPPSAASREGALSMIDEPAPPRPWFGPERVGYGIRPQTWQGWLIVLGGSAALIVVARVLLR